MLDILEGERRQKKKAVANGQGWAGERRVGGSEC